MVDRILDIINRIICYFKKAPVLKQKYLISDSNQTLAELTNPEFDDMFWYSFLLTPTVNDPVLLEKLYSAHFWLGREIKFTEDKRDLRVSFSLALLKEEDGDPWGINSRPERVKLRGPYAVDLKR